MVGSSNAYDGEVAVSDVVAWVKSGTPVMSKGQRGAPNAMIYVNSNGHREFIESRADSTTNNNLLSLPRF